MRKYVFLPWQFAKWGVTSTKFKFALYILIYYVNLCVCTFHLMSHIRYDSCFSFKRKLIICTQEEQERQEQYFSVLEKKEQMEEKMSNTKELKVKAWSCKQVPLVP